jgi:Raf kinase inhibitor-like YbhB/YbcL family protein
MNRKITGLLLAGGVVLAALGSGIAQAAGVFTLTSPAYQDNAALAARNVASRAVAEQLHLPFAANCVGENVSPPLAWHDPPAGTKSYALLMFDPEGRAPAGVSHMVLYGIPASVTGFAEGELSQPSEKFVGGKNLMGVGIYFGPCTPPNVDWHHYTLTLVATDLDPKTLQPGMTREQLTAALNGHVKGSAGLILRFRHP